MLLGGVPGVGPAKVLILGGGVVGLNAAKMAAGLGASVCVLDIDLDRLRYLADILPPNCCVLYSDRYTIREQLSQADLVIGAVLVPGARAPCLIEEDDLLRMPPGAVIVDVAIDQGGCCATSRPTTHAQPVFVVHDVVHYCVTNIPGLSPERVRPPCAMQRCRGCGGLLIWGRKAAQQFPELARAVNILSGHSYPPGFS